jgi:hypothetical protein
MKKVVLGFAKRQTERSQYSHWDMSTNDLIQRVVDNFDRQLPGYRDGVIKIPVPPDGFYSPVKVLEAGDQIKGDFSARQAGEEPRLHFYIHGTKTPAKAVEIILYRHDVLAENNERSDNDAEWEIVAVNAAPTEESQPIQPMTLLANHFELSGGTKTNMSDQELVAQLRESVNYWKDKILVRPNEHA